MPVVFIVIVTYNGAFWIEKCLKSTLSSTMPNNVLVIDNRSTDNTISIIKEKFPHVKILRQEINHGFGKSNNIGIEHSVNSGAEYVFLLNQDAWIESNTIENLIFCHRKNKQYGILSPIHMSGSGLKLDPNFAAYSNLNDYGKVEKQIVDELLPVDFVNAAAWLLSRDCILSIGGFDPIFNHYGEDRDYCNRCSYHGFKIGIDLRSKIYHDRNYSNNNLFRKDYYFLNAIAISHVKNINYNIIYNYFTWNTRVIKKAIKWLIMFKPIMILIEIGVLLKVIQQCTNIKKSRHKCKISTHSFLNISND